MTKPFVHACDHSSANTSLHQTLDELQFERGIWTAAINNDIARLRLLIDKDSANVNKTDNHGYTALHYAARAGHMTICEILIASGADVNARLRSGDTALHRASYMGNKDVVRLLMHHKAESCKGADGQTPLHKAVQQHQYNVAQLLIDSCPELLQVTDNAERLPRDLYIQGREDDSLWNSLLGTSPVT